MELTPWNPFREMERMRSAFDRILGDPFYTAPQMSLRFPVEVLEQNREVIVRTELAGVDPKDVDVRITDEGITIRGERKVEADRNRNDIHHTERFYGAFSRSVTFPVPVDSVRARATFKHGVLEVRAPKRNPDDGRDGRRLDIEVH